MYGLVPEKKLRLVYEPWLPSAPPKAGKPFYLPSIVEFVTFYEIITQLFETTTQKDGTRLRIISVSLTQFANSSENST